MSARRGESAILAARVKECSDVELECCGIQQYHSSRGKVESMQSRRRRYRSRPSWSALIFQGYCSEQKHQNQQPATMYEEVRDYVKGGVEVR